MKDKKLEAELEHHKRFPHRGTEEYLNKKKEFWDSVLSVLECPIDRIPEPILEVGNGPYGFFLSLEGKEIYGIDPLNDEYKKIFPHMNGFGVRFITESIEDVENVLLSRTVLCFNVLDHVNDMEKSIVNMLRLSTDDAIFLVGIDYYPNSLIKIIMSKTWRWIDPPHPYHLDMNELERLFSKYFTIQRVCDTSGFKYVQEKEGPVRIRKMINPLIAMKAVIFWILRKLGVGKDCRADMKKMAVFVMRKR